MFHTLTEVRNAATQDEGFCFVCGTRQDSPEGRWPFGQCEKCGEYAVIEAATIIKILDILDFEEED